jgi:transposase
VSSKERRRFTREFKLAALARLETAKHVGKLAAELGVRRELLHKWRTKYAAGGACALTTSGRPRPVPMPPPDVGATRAEDDAARAQRRITELERKVGQQALELDFFRAALRHVREQRQPTGAPGETASTQ